MTQRKKIRNEVLFGEIEAILREGGSATIRIKGSSMRPFLRNCRDTATLSPLPAHTSSGWSGLEVGMLLLFRQGEQYCLHRLRSIERGMLTMEGDGNCGITELIAPCDAVAWVSSIGRGRRTIKYGSACWRLLTRYSLLLKNLRTAYRTLLNRLK